MTKTLLAVSAAYVLIAVLLLSAGLTARYAWWLKASAIVVTSLFFVEAFFASKSLLGWPGGGPLPAKFQLLWTRVVEPDLKLGERGAIYLWLEEIDANNVPSGLPRAYRLPYSIKLADRTLKARDEIMAGHPQEGLSDDLSDSELGSSQAQRSNLEPDGGASSSGGNVEPQEALEQIPRVDFRPMPMPSLPPKP
jgi:hypothetical protein